MRKIIDYEMTSRRAHDEDGKNLTLEFLDFGRVDFLGESSLVLLDGVLHECADIRIHGSLLSFWATPATDGTQQHEVDANNEPSPSVTLQTVCDVFNRLAKLEREGHHGGQTFYVAETVWALLTVMGYVIDFVDVDRILIYYGLMLDGSFREMNTESLSFDLEGFEICGGVA